MISTIMKNQAVEGGNDWWHKECVGEDGLSEQTAVDLGDGW